MTENFKKSDSMVSKANASAKKNYSMVNPAQMCAQIAEKINGSTKIYETSPTRYGYINTKAKGNYGVMRMNGSEMQVFDTLDDAINYANTVNTDDTLVKIGVRQYKKSNYSLLADCWAA